MATKRTTTAAEQRAHIRKQQLGTAGGVPGYTVRLSRSESGSIICRFKTADTGLRAEKLLSAKIYQVAGELETRAAYRGDRWCVSPAAYNQELSIEFCEGDDDDDALGLLKEILVVASVMEVLR